MLSPPPKWTCINIICAQAFDNEHDRDKHEAHCATLTIQQRRAANKVMGNISAVAVPLSPLTPANAVSWDSDGCGRNMPTSKPGDIKLRKATCEKYKEYWLLRASGPAKFDTRDARESHQNTTCDKRSKTSTSTAPSSSTSLQWSCPNPGCVQKFDSMTVRDVHQQGACSKMRTEDRNKETILATAFNYDPLALVYMSGKTSLWHCVRPCGHAISEQNPVAIQIQKASCVYYKNSLT
ncbi:hypothetical protein QBC38DRAFT_460672 [Podospora fimiseda]|uniref:Uncharacterized protein n=1 Tax=Podospora fimiseda TaxID=252190 RepID=A0AAN7BFZ9_9PEZI|nr:hypothetical protein QBC38DRAFT_460672 [Podospora fimiseda]